MRDRSWIRLLLSKDKTAGEQFVREHYPRIERLLRCLTGSADVARDLTQQTFVRAWQGLPDFQGRSSLATWLHRIAYHEYTHWLRDRRDHAPLETALHVAATQGDHDWNLVLLPQALSRLSEELRDTFVLHYVQELSVAEVAQVLDVPKGTVKSRLFTARQQLREILHAAMYDTPSAIPAEYRVEPRTDHRNRPVPALVLGQECAPEPTADLHVQPQRGQ